MCPLWLWVDEGGAGSQSCWFKGAGSLACGRYSQQAQAFLSFAHILLLL